MEFIEAPVFTQLLGGYLADDEYGRLQIYLAVNPDAGAVMPGTGGCRKLRWVDQRRGKGKRGGLRLIYYHLLQDGQIWLLTLYAKDEVVDLSARERRLLKAAIDAEVRHRSQRRRLKGR